MGTFSMHCEEPLSTSPLPLPAGPEPPVVLAPLQATAVTGEATATSGSPLTPEHLRLVAEANQRARKLRRAAHVAGFNGWSLATFAALSLPFALFSLSGLLVTAGLAVTAWHEFRGRRLLRAFDTSAPRLLGWNQFGLLVLLVSYSLWSLYQVYTQPSLTAQYPELSGMTLDIESLQKTIALAVYGGLIAGTLLFQGINSLYYFGLARHLREHLAQTEDWVVELQRASQT